MLSGGMSDLPDSAMTILAPTGHPYSRTPALLRSVIASCMSVQLTTLYAVDRFGFSETSGNTLVLHIIGANELSGLHYKKKFFGEIMHQLPYLKSLVVEVINPNIELDISCSVEFTGNHGIMEYKELG